MLVRFFIIIITSLFYSSLSYADVTELNNEALKALQAEGVTIIDVRRADEWEKTGVIEGSHPITFFDKNGRYDVKAWLNDVAQWVEPSDPIVLICAHGVRSSKIAAFLDQRMGFTEVHNVSKGIVNWIKSDQPVVSWKKTN